MILERALGKRQITYEVLDTRVTNCVKDGL